MTRLPLGALPLLLAAALATGCGASDDPAGAATGAGAAGAAAPSTNAAARGDAAPAERVARTTAAAAPAAQPRRGIVVKVARHAQFGPIVGDIRGQAFYLFDKERSAKPQCYGACAQAWPPVLARGRPVAGRGLDAGLLGTTRRSDGRLQVTYRDRPMYYYVSDSPGVVLCHDVYEYGGQWLVVQPDGSPVP